MTMDSRDVLNAISFCNGMGLDVLVVIMSCGPNHITTNQRGECSKQFPNLIPSLSCVCLRHGGVSLIEIRLYLTLFELFQSLQRSYSWMKYYNSELGSIKRNHFDRNVLKELLDDVKKSIENS